MQTHLLPKITQQNFAVIYSNSIRAKKIYSIGP